MKHTLIAVLSVLVLLASLLAQSPAVHAQGNEKSPYPTITVIFSDGKEYNITGKMWGVTIYPYIEGRVHSYNWQDKITYLFFDRSLKGLNPYGIDFVRALERMTLEQFQKNIFECVGNALNYTANMDSDGDGFTNIQELNNGTYPGDPNDYPGKNAKTLWDLYGGYIIVTILVASIFVLYFVFNREGKE